LDTEVSETGDAGAQAGRRFCTPGNGRKYMSKAIPKYKPADTGNGKALTLVHCNVIDVIQGGVNHDRTIPLHCLWRKVSQEYFISFYLYR
jgi:hypothetical protein